MCIRDRDKLEAAYRESLAHPIGMPTVKELAHKGSKVVFVVPDRVKGCLLYTSSTLILDEQGLSLRFFGLPLRAMPVSYTHLLCIGGKGPPVKGITEFSVRLRRRRSFTRCRRWKPSSRCPCWCARAP